MSSIISPIIKSKRDVETRSHSHNAKAIAVCLALSICVTLYSVFLAARYYQSFGPFFDSLAYDNQLAAVHDFALRSGIFDAIRSTRGSTVALPWFPVALLARIVPASRLFGPVFQGILFALSLFSASQYLSRRSGWTVGSIVTALVTLCMFKMLYRVDGGLCDFRMDIGFYLLFSCSIAWLFVARRSRSASHWIYFGLFSGLTCLDRATAPVYFLATAGPLVVYFILDGLRQKDWAWRFFLVSLASTCCAALSIWMYLTRWNQLKWYYLIWNRHANTHGPFLRSFTWHLSHVADNVGPVATLALIAFLLIGPSGILRQYRGLRATLLSTEWGLLYAGIAPVLVLGIDGSGHNPFVSMPAVAGLSLFCFSPTSPSIVITKPKTCITGISNPAILSIVIVLATYSAADGLVGNIRGQGGKNSMNGQLEVADRLIQYAKPNRVNVFSCVAFGHVNNASLVNVLMFDKGFRSMPFGVAKSDIRLAADPEFQHTEAVGWNALRGHTDGDKIKALGVDASKKLNFVILDDALTRTALERRGFHCKINTYSDAIYSSILKQGKWVPIGGPITISSSEVSRVYRNLNR